VATRPTLGLEWMGKAIHACMVCGVSGAVAMQLKLGIVELAVWADPVLPAS
jgi:hypothetical protein